jgi:hypothetical protein
MKINVTQENITLGTCQEAHCCAIALALLGAFPNAKEVSVTERDDIDIREGGCWSQYEAADEDKSRVGKFIVDFDAGRKVSPMSFELVEREVETEPDYDEDHSSWY